MSVFRLSVSVDVFTPETAASESYIQELKKLCKPYIGGGMPFVYNYTHIYIVKAMDQSNEIIGGGVGTVYKEDTIGRCDQWHFGTNYQRMLWIDKLWVITKMQGCGIGRQIVKKLENVLSKHINEASRPNIYVMGVTGSGGFYRKCNYQLVDTPDHQEDEDYPSSYKYGACVGFWYAKNLLNPEKFPSNEKSDHMDLICAVKNRLQSDYQSYFLDPVPDLDFLIQWLENDDYSKVDQKVIDQIRPENECAIECYTEMLEN